MYPWRWSNDIDSASLIGRQSLLLHVAHSLHLSAWFLRLYTTYTNHLRKPHAVLRSSLYEDYEPHMFLWFLAPLARSILIVAIRVLAWNDPPTQVSLAALVRKHVWTQKLSLPRTFIYRVSYVGGGIFHGHTVLCSALS